jgi:hypothetical protein
MPRKTKKATKPGYTEENYRNAVHRQRQFALREIAAYRTAEDFAALLVHATLDERDRDYLVSMAKALVKYIQSPVMPFVLDAVGCGDPRTEPVRLIERTRAGYPS